jgi:outer membrane biosynthesis protein TonB
MPSSKHLKAPKIICNHLTLVSGPSSHKKDDKVQESVISEPSSFEDKEEQVEKHKTVDKRKSKKEERPKKTEKPREERKEERAKKPKKADKSNKEKRSSCWSTKMAGGSSSTYSLHPNLDVYANATP